MMHGSAGERFANRAEHRVALVPISGAGPDFDQLVSRQIHVDFFEDCLGQAVVTNQDNGAQWMGSGTKSAAFAWGEFHNSHKVDCTGMAKNKFSKEWVMQHINDPFVKLATQKGYRARAAFKLTEILDAEKLMRRGDVIVDLGSAPGSWSQVARERLVGKGGVIEGRILALDLLPMEPIAGVEFIQGDFSEDEVLESLNALLDGAKVDLVMSDMAPNLSGVGSADSARIQQTVDLALDFALMHLKPEGALIVKAFHGSGFSQIVESFKRHFKRVVEKKPKASRVRSSETFLIAKGRKQ